MGKERVSNGMIDTFKWLIVVGLVISGFIASIYFSQLTFLLRFAGLLVLLAVIAVVVLSTQLGSRFWRFLRDAKNELRKVVWPTRQETMQSTMLVSVVVVIMGLILWGVDAVLFYMVSNLMG